MLSNFTFHTDLGLGVIQVYPANDDLVFSDEKDEAFGFYRRILETRLIFKNDDFQAFYEVELSGLCSQADLEIRYNTEPYYAGIIKFRTSNMEWDVDKCRVDVRLEPQDDYTCLVENWETEFNVLDEKYTRETLSFIGGEYETFFCEDDPGDIEYRDYLDCISGGASAGGWTVTRHYAVNNSDPATYKVITNYQREIITVPCISGAPDAPAGDGWILVTDNCPTDATYARKLQVMFDPDASFDLGGPTANPDEVFYDEVYTVIGQTFTGGIGEYTNGVLLNDLFSNICEGLTFVSNILGVNISGDSPDTIPYDDTRLYNLVVLQKTDAKDPSGIQPATREIWTMLEMLRYLKTAYDLEPRIIGDTFRIEHSTYWNTEQGTDLTGVNFEKYIRGLNKYTYETGGIARREEWRYTEEVTTEFKGSAIMYDCYAKDDPPSIEYVMDRINNDVAFVTTYPEKIANDGFCILETAVNMGTRYIVSRYLYPPGTNLLMNGMHAIPNLIDHFHRYERPSLTGTMDSLPETFESELRRKKQVEIKFKLSAEEWRDLVPDELINTQIGWGQAVSLKWSARSCTVIVELMHE